MKQLKRDSLIKSKIMHFHHTHPHSKLRPIPVFTLINIPKMLESVFNVNFMRYSFRYSITLLTNFISFILTNTLAPLCKYIGIHRIISHFTSFQRFV